MARKILSSILIVFSVILLIASLVGIGAAWYYNTPLTSEIIAKAEVVDGELSQAQNALENAQEELKRALRIVIRAEESLESFSEQTIVAKELLDTVTGVLDETITPSLEASKEKIDQAQETLDELRETVEAINKIPFVDLELPDIGMLNFFVEITDSLEGEITRVEDMAEEASTFLNDTSYLMGGDLLETKESIKNLQEVISEYEVKISTWREQLSETDIATPNWIDRASIILSIFLIWFGFSQLGLLLHGLTLWYGVDPLEALRAKG